MGVLEDVLASVRNLADTVAIQTDLISDLRERIEVLEQGFIVPEVVEFDPPRSGRPSDG